MTTDTNPPEWAMKRATTIMGSRALDIPSRYWLDTRDAIARALAATAERAVRETREADARFVEAHSLGNHGLVRRLDDDQTLRPVAAAIRSLKPQYQEPTNE